MKQQLHRCARWLAVLLLPVLAGTGCAAISAADTTSSQATVSPTQADLTALETVVERLRAGNSLAIQQDDTVDIQANDRIAVDESGRGLLRFNQDRLLIEIFRDTELQVSEAQLDPEGFIFVRLSQTFGTTRAELNTLADARLKLETEYATITAPDGDTELLVCHAKAVTCIAALEGTAEVEALGEVVTVNAGEATYVFPGEPPRPALCSNEGELTQWIEDKRDGEEVPPLGKVVSGWPQEPCQTQAPPASTTITPSASPSLPLADGMVSIEGGRYEVGAPEADDYHTGVQEIELAGFWIDEHEVTNAQYQAFLDATGNTPPVNWPGEANHPVKGVSWDEASAYCAWANKRLPTEAEWEAAARGSGPEPPLYPWGPDPSADGQAYDLPLGDTYEVGSQPFNRSPLGVYDMAGNVWEWVGEPYGPVPDGNKIVRGGRYGLLRDMAYRQASEPNNQRFVAVAGIRCAADQVQGD
jgi:formylglycine-generating enzyme required for sulfatase activity